MIVSEWAQWLTFIGIGLFFGFLGYVWYTMDVDERRMRKERKGRAAQREAAAAGA